MIAAHPIAVVHQVPGTRVALHQDGVAVVVGNAVKQMVELDLGEQIDRTGALLTGELCLDSGQLLALVLADRPHRTEARQLEGSRAGGVPGGEVAHEVLRHRDGHGRIPWCLEPRLTRRTVHEEHVQ